MSTTMSSLMTGALERFGEGPVLAGGGLAVGLAFGLFAQRSRFCFRAAAVDAFRGTYGQKLAVWLLAFSVALLVVQALALAGALDVAKVRQLGEPGSLSAALVGGLVFGAGMVMTRGCPSRLIVLTSTGNLRALLSGLVFAVAAQATIAGPLAPLRQAIASWWPVDPGPLRSVLGWFDMGPAWGVAAGLAGMGLAVAIGARARLRGGWHWAGAAVVGLTVAAAWGFNQWVARDSFEPVLVQGLTFSAPSAEWLMRLVQTPAPKLGFEFGLVPGTVLGAWLGGLVGRELKIEGFHDGHSMRRYLVGAVLMGFGAVLAGGCAIGAGVTGGSLLAITALVALAAMVAGAWVADRVLDVDGPVMPGLSNPLSVRPR